MELMEDFEIKVGGNRVVFYDITRQKMDGLYKYRYSFLYHTGQGISNCYRTTTANDFAHLEEKLVKIFTYMLKKHGYIYTEEPERPFRGPVRRKHPKKPSIKVHPCFKCGSRKVKLSRDKDRFHCLECGYSDNFASQRFSRNSIYRHPSLLELRKLKKPSN